MARRPWRAKNAWVRPNPEHLRSAASIHGGRPMRLIILLGRLAIALPFIISAAAISFGNAGTAGPGRGPRYTIPLETEAGKPLEAVSLTDWVRENSDFAKGCATRVIPLGV